MPAKPKEAAAKPNVDVSIQNPFEVHGIHGINRNDKSNQSGPFSQNALRQRESPGGHPLFGNADATFSS